MIRIVHSIGGCGGTVLSRCLGILPGVVLFSEINPLSVKLFPHFDPLYQDRNWFQLLDRAELHHFSRLDLGRPGNFRAMIGALHQRADASGRRLILRDYNYIEFVGVPYTDKPRRRRIIYDALPADVPVKSIAFIRHPIHQWLSLCKHEHVRARLSASSFCEAYLFFLRDLGDLPLFKYEEFVEQPSSELRRVCNELDLQFDPSFLERFHPYD